MSDFHDPELRQHLGRLSGPYPDDNAAFAAWQRRVGQARRRRAMAFTTGAAMSLIVAVVAFAALQRPDHHRIVPGDKASETSEVSTIAPTTMAKPTTTESTAPSTTASTTTMAPETTTSVVEDTAPAPTDPQDVSGGQQPVTTTKKPSSGGTTHTTQATQPPPPTMASPEPQGETKTFSSIGGTLTVQVDGDHLVIVATTPAEGFEIHETDPSGAKVGVTFTSQDHKSEITTWLSGGKIYGYPTEKNVGGHDGTFPGESWGGGDSGDHSG